jgi:hypothetical protein
MDYYLFRREIGKNKRGEPIKAWYYWYYDPAGTGKRMRKSCGAKNRPVLLKREAEAIVEKLKEKDREYLAIRAEKESVTIAKMAEAMFADGSSYLKRRREDGYIKKDVTLREVRGFLRNFIVKNYGHLKPEEIDPVAVDEDLMKTSRSSSWRNRAVGILNWILDEAIWLKMIKIKPVLKWYTRTTKTKSILTQGELEILFLDDFDALAKIWDRKKAASVEGFMFGTLFALKTSTGSRSGEMRAISPSQLIISDGNRVARMVGQDGKEALNPFGKTKHEIFYGLLLNRMYDRSEEIVEHLKKGNEG